MMRKILIVLIIASLLAAAIPVSNAEVSNKKSVGVEPYKGIAGAGSAFYGLKLFLQDLELAFAGSDDARLQMRLSLGKERLAEAYAAALANNPDATNDALTQFVNNLEQINSALDSEALSDENYIVASDMIAEDEDTLSGIAEDSDVSQEISDLFDQTLVTADTIKNGRPFIWCDNTNTAYFLPPGQMKKIEAAVSAGKFGTNHTPAGLGKKGYYTPEPLRLENGTIVWPWDGGYNDYVEIMNSDTENGVSDNVALVSEMTKHGKGNGKGNLGGKGNGKK